MEVLYITAQEKDESEAMDRVKLIQSLSVRVVESNESLNMRAGSLKAKNRISVADAYVVAVCQKYNGIRVHDKFMGRFDRWFYLAYNLNVNKQSDYRRCLWRLP